MKTLFILALSVFVLEASATTLKYDSLPPAIKAAVDSQQFDRRAVRAEQTFENGRVFYKVQIRQAGKNPELVIASDGRIVKDNRVVTDQADRAQKGIQAALGKSEKLRIGDTPVAVQNAIKAEVGPLDSESMKNAQVTAKDQGGRKVYQINYKPRSGQTRQLAVREDGYILRSDTRLPSARKDKVTQSGQRLVQLKDLPTEARKSVEREAAGAPVGPIEIESTEARNIFKVELNQQGQKRYIWVEQDGRVLKQSEAAGTEKKNND